MRAKLWGNLCFNPISAPTRATLGVIATDPGTRALSRLMMLEAQAVGDMLQDLERGRPMEIDALVAAVQELGRAVGMAPSLLDSVLQAEGETLVGPIGISPKAGAMDPELTDVVKA